MLAYLLTSDLAGHWHANTKYTKRSVATVDGLLEYIKKGTLQVWVG